MSRLKHFVHESLKSRPLFCNSVLMMLIRVIANNVFKDYETMKKLLKIESSKNEMYHLWQNESVLSKLFFHVVFIDEMKKVNIFSRRLRKLRVRVEYLRFLIIHDFRAESLYLVDRVSLFSLLTLLLELTWMIDKLYSTTQRMKHDEHWNERIYCDFYMSNNVEIDLQENYFDDKLRSIVNDRFRELTLHRNSELWQALLIRKQHQLKNTSKFIVIETEIDALTSKTKTDSTAKEHQQTLMTDKRKLVTKKLSRC